MHGERMPDFMNGEKHLSLVARQGAGAFHDWSTVAASM
jgi:hypothetical protein